MTTERMDYQSVLKDAESSPHYSELPIHTVMGHIHLHVNNIAKANSFFVDVLGFNKVLEYGPSAMFISDAMYHHHIGYNTWLGTTNRNMDERDLGLIEYRVNLPQSKLVDLVNRFNLAKITFTQDQKSLVLNDINGTKVIFEIV